MQLVNFRLGSVLRLCALLLVAVWAVFPLQAKDKNEALDYEIRCGGSGAQGYYIVEVRAYVDKANQVGKDIALRCAVHGVLFKGFAGEQGCIGQRPLAGSALVEAQNAAFFTQFFQPGGGYASYGQVVDGSLKTSRVGKRFCVTATVNIAKDQLRRDLEKAGVLKSLSAGF